MDKETLIPVAGVVTKIRRDTGDVKTFLVEKEDGGKPFLHQPGQCAMLSIPGAGEAMFSITSSPTAPEMEFSIKQCGCLTQALHELEEGNQVFIRGPYGNHFPVEGDFLGQDLLFVAGGIGLAPLRSVINYVRDKREQYGKVAVVYGARSAEDLVDYQELTEVWQKEENLDLYLTIDRAEAGWTGHTGFVPDYLAELSFSPSYLAVVCGPPVMIKFSIEKLLALGFQPEQIYTTMEMRMKCGVGKCGRCNIGSKYVCKDGPVFRWDQLGALPDEY